MADLSPHVLQLHKAVTHLDQNPHALMHAYVHAALEREGGCVSACARRLGMHRRTLQRMLGKSAPPRRGEIGHD